MGISRYFFACTVMVAVASLAAMAGAKDFGDSVNLQPLRTVSVQHNQTLKTLDSFARQMVYAVTGKSTLDGRPALWVILDMGARPEQYVDRNIIKIRNLPLREDMAGIEGLEPAERMRIVKEGTVSLKFWLRTDVREAMGRIQSTAAFKAEAVGQFQDAAITLAYLLDPGLLQEGPERRLVPQFPPAAMIPPATGGDDDHVWHRAVEIWGNAVMAAAAGQMPPEGVRVPPPLPRYTAQQNEMLKRVSQATLKFVDAWRAQDASGVNTEIGTLAELLPQINPAVYPTPAKRKVEVVYNGLAMLTVPGAAMYFVAFVMFLVAANSGVSWIRRAAVAAFVVALGVHTAGIGIRWWLVGSVFPPIKNMFESVMFAAWFAAAVGLALELWRRKGIFGAAAGFFGGLALMGIFATPYVVGREIGAEIGQSAGILMTYWLYIHVMLVVASYGLIGMGFVLSVWWMAAHLARSRSTEPQNATDGAEALAGTDAGEATVRCVAVIAPRGVSLATLDSCNVVIMQLAFWLLGLGIITGALWADQSWGRPWGWDPKETFALVTWIVYLVVVHVRVVTPHKAWWTSVLCIAGFFIMLFNWIGVNFFLVGLHSYA